MKTTKTVDIELCDRCGQERSWLAKCANCGKEICSACTEHIHVRVQRATPNNDSKHRSWMISEVVPKHVYSTRYCADCGDGVAVALLATGLVEEKKDA